MQIWTSFSDISMEIAIATNVVKQWQTPLIRRSGIPKRNWDITTSM